MGTTIDNPVINNPYDEPSRHFRFDDGGITDEVVPGRRRSEYFVPVPPTRKRGAQLELDSQWTLERLRPNDFVNTVRARVDLWRKRNYPYVTPTTRRLLTYWADAARENRVLFCQREAAEVAIYLAEAASDDGQAVLRRRLSEYNAEYNDRLPRVALKMATGSGKTVVMAMLIAWQVLNKSATPRDPRFGSRFLVVAPGVTIRDRLRVLYPEHPGNYYRERDLVPPDLVNRLGQSKIVVVNYHVFLPRVTREGVGLAKNSKDLLLGGSSGAVDPFVETPRQVAARVAKEFGKPSDAGGLVVLNDEAHHCYREKPDERVEVELDADGKAEVKEREEQARVWFRGLQALRDRMGVKAAYDLSATPFFLAGSGYGEGTLFPWVASDFSLVDAVECGIVKVPRLPVDDDAAGEQVVLRNLWDQISAFLPKRTSKPPRTRPADPQLPPKLETALYTLYADYKRSFETWEDAGAERGETPPVFIVVCANTTVSKLVYDWIAGYDRENRDLDGNDVVVPSPGKLALFNNADGNGGWFPRPRSIIVDSAQLESGEQLTSDFRALAAREIAEFTDDLRTRFPGRDPDQMSDSDLLREVMNTVGKPGKLGAEVRCVVSVSMLTEGWDANTVTHILGVRAFRTPLLTEQVVGRGLRRRSYEVGDDGLFAPEYAEIYGVPFEFMPVSGTAEPGSPRRAPQAVKALPDRADARITFPRLLGYRLEMPDPDLSADFSAPQSRMRVTTDLVPTETHVGDITGYDKVVYPEYLKRMREQEVAFKIAHRLIDREYRDSLGNPRPWLFPAVLKIVKRWLSEAVEYEGGTYPGLLLLATQTERSVEKIKYAIVADEERPERLLPVFDADREGTTDVVDFTTTRPAEATDPQRCHVDHVVVDSGWESTVAKVLEGHPAVAAYVKNDHLGFDVPYVYEGHGARYLPDFLARLRDSGDGIRRTLIVEVSGGAKRHHSPGTVQEKADTTRNLWIPAVNRHGGWGRWAYIDIVDPGRANAEIGAACAELLDATVVANPTHADMRS